MGWLTEEAAVVREEQCVVCAARRSSTGVVSGFSWGLQVLSTEGHRGPSQAAIPDSNTTVLGGAVGFGGTVVDGLSGACTALAVGPAPD